MTDSINSPMAQRPAVLLEAVEVERVETNRVFRLTVDHFEVRPGETVAIVGPSGSGKSTLLDLLGLILPPVGFKRFLVGGEDVDVVKNSIPDAAKRRRGIGFVLQHGALLPFLNVRDNVHLGAALAGKSLDPLDVDDLLSRLGLFELQKVFPGKISGGQRQRVALARALAMKPPLILADEPTGSVDTQQAMEIGSIMREVARQNGLATVLVTHDLSLADHSADRIWRIEAEFPHPGLVRSRLIAS